MIRLIPTPRYTTMTEARVAVAPRYTAEAVFTDAAATLAEYARRTHGVSLTAGLIRDEGGITFSLDPSLPAESYTLTVTTAGATVKAADPEGAQHAAVTIIQLMEKAGDGLTLPVGEIADEPRCTWRAVMFDLARFWHDLPFLYEYVDLCCFYKIRYLHLHFTDDQSYTLPSRAFPELPTKGRHYTEEEIQGLIAYAKSRGVQIVPEIDVPGHATSFSDSCGERFAHNGVICLSEESMSLMETLFRELCELFSDSDYIHMGGDEAIIERWLDCDKCLDAFRRDGVEVDKHLETAEGRRDLTELMYATFIRRICKTILSCGKTPIVWEGFCEKMNHMIPREAVIVSWENLYQPIPLLLKAGFRIINASWRPLYVVTHKGYYWSPEEVYNWNVYTWRCLHPDSPYHGQTLLMEPTDQVEGGQLLAWGDWSPTQEDNIAEGVRAEQRLMEERTPCLSENVWNREKTTDWTEFSGRMAQVCALYETFRNHSSI